MAGIGVDGGGSGIVTRIAAQPVQATTADQVGQGDGGATIATRIQASRKVLVQTALPACPRFSARTASAQKHPKTLLCGTPREPHGNPEDMTTANQFPMSPLFIGDPGRN